MSTNFQIHQSHQNFTKMCLIPSSCVQTQPLDAIYLKSFIDYMQKTQLQVITSLNIQNLVRKQRPNCHKFIQKQPNFKKSSKYFMRLKKINEEKQKLQIAKNRAESTINEEFNFLPETPLNTTQFIREQKEKEEVQNQGEEKTCLYTGSMLDLVCSDMFSKDPKDLCQVQQFQKESD